MHSPERDPAQLDLLGAPALTPLVAAARDYVRPARSAPRSVQLRNPFQ